MLASGKPIIVMADQGTELFEFLGDGAVLTPPGDSETLAHVITQVAHKMVQVNFGGNDVRTSALDAKQNLPLLNNILTGARSCKR